MNQEIINAIRKDIGPLRILVDCEVVDHVYYLTVDGSRTYPTAEYWYEKWGKNFTEFTVMCLKHHLHKTIDATDIQLITETKLKIKLGTVFDFVKNFD